MTIRKFELYMAVGTILTAVSFFAFALSEDCTIKINENTQKALVNCMLGIDARIYNQTEASHRFWGNATNLINKYPEMNYKRIKWSNLGILSAFLSIILYLISFRAVFDEREKIRAGKIDKIDADQAKADKYRFDYQ
jgi:hypothetical protein